MFRVALTHDIDRTEKTYQYFTHFIRALKSGDYRKALHQILTINQRKSVYFNFEKIIDTELKYGVKSTFFFLIETMPFKLLDISNWKLSLGRYNISEPRILSMINYLDKNGWEIGLHGSYLSYKNMNLLKIEKDSLEEILGHPVEGIRQHYLNLYENTWEIQKQLGFKYDASWGYTDRIGFKDNKYLPFRPFNDEFIVFPLPVMDSCYMNTNERIKILHRIIDECEKFNAILVVNWHNDIFNETEENLYYKNYCEIVETCLSLNADFDTLFNFYKRMS